MCVCVCVCVCVVYLQEEMRQSVAPAEPVQYYFTLAQQPGAVQVQGTQQAQQPGAQTATTIQPGQIIIAQPQQGQVPLTPCLKSFLQGLPLSPPQSANDTQQDLKRQQHKKAEMNMRILGNNKGDGEKWVNAWVQPAAPTETQITS